MANTSGTFKEDALDQQIGFTRITCSVVNLSVTTKILAKKHAWDGVQSTEHIKYQYSESEICTQRGKMQMLFEKLHLMQVCREQRAPDSHQLNAA